MIDLKLNPEAVLAMSDGEQCRIDDTVFFLEEHSTSEDEPVKVYLTVVGSRVEQYNELLVAHDRGGGTAYSYPKYEQYIKHLRHPEFKAVMRREEMLEILKAGTYSIG